MAMETYTALLDDLQRLRQQWRGRQVGTGLLLTLAATMLALVAGTAMDNLLQPGTAVRLILGLLLWGTLGLGLLYLVLRRWVEDHRDDYFAALIERRHPELANRLINALQLGRGTNPGSRRVIEAIVNDAARLQTDLDLSDCLDTHRLRQAGLAFLALLTLLAVWALLAAPRLFNGAMRIALPLADIPAYTATRIPSGSVKPGNARVPEGATVLVEAQVTGRIPPSALLTRITDDGVARSLAMTPDAGRPATFRATLAQLETSFGYSVKAGDGQSQQFRIEVVRRPRAERILIAYVPPVYTGQRPQPGSGSDGEIAGLAGTVVNVELLTSKPLKQATMETEGAGGQTVAFRPGKTPLTWCASFVLWSKDAHHPDAIDGPKLTAPTRYQLHLLDTDGYENTDPLWRTIALVKDQPPVVTIAVPGRDLQRQTNDTLDLLLDARDDYGVGLVQVLYKVNNAAEASVLTRFPPAGAPTGQVQHAFAWKLATLGLKSGDWIQYWSVVDDLNTITGPGHGESRTLSIFLVSPQQAVVKSDIKMDDYTQVLEELLRLQRENRAQSVSSAPFPGLIARQALIRHTAQELARAMEKDAAPMASMVHDLDELSAGLMVEAIRYLEQGRDAGEIHQADGFRNQSLPVQDKIVAQLQALLARLQRNEQARNALRRMAKKDQPAYKAITEVLGKMVNDLTRLENAQMELANKFEKMPKRPVDELNQESLDALKNLDELRAKWGRWAKGSVDELTKLPTGFVDDFGLRKDVNRIKEEIEQAESRSKAAKLEVALEDLGAGLATKMKEDLEMWMMDSPDAVQWVLEEPLANQPMNIPEMPLPDELEDMIGDLLQKEEEFDQEADDITSAWGDNLDQAGWAVSDGPISSFSAKGKTGNDLPNNMEVSGRSGDGRRGKSSGQMVGDTSRALDGRKTPARLNSERYEPGTLKQEADSDPNGATGGGKKAGAGRKGLQGGTPPDFVKDMQRLSAKQADIREKAEQVAKQLDTSGIHSRRLTESIPLMKGVEQDYRDLRYDDAARKRRVALGTLESAVTELDQSTAVQLSRARDLPPALREELIQSADESYPEGYETMLKSYFRALSEQEP